MRDQKPDRAHLLRQRELDAAGACARS
jgi:hypothetical protein